MGSIAVAVRQLPGYKSRRYKHNSFVLRNWLFLVFGELKDTMFASNVECLCMSDPEA